MAFNFNLPKTTPEFTVPTAAPISAPTALGGSGDMKASQKPSGLFGTAAPFSFGTTAPKTAAVTSLNPGGATTAKPAFGASIAPTISSAAAGAPPQFNLGAATSAAASTTFTPIATSLGATIAATMPTLKLTTTTLPPPPPASSVGTAATLSLPAPNSSSIAVTTTKTTSAPATSLSIGTNAGGATNIAPTTTTSITYAQLEDSINKWTNDLEEQGKFFINQAKQLNAWDNLLVSNGDKILNLNEMIEKAKEEQKQLDQELDFVLAQQNELDELSLPLEKQLAEIPVTDQNRFQMYQTSEIIDSQMKQMSEDLKEIIDHLNESTKNEDISDPITQISRILNAHMNSLQWIDKNTNEISSHLDHVSKLHEVYRKNHLNL